MFNKGAKMQKTIQTAYNKKAGDVYSSAFLFRQVQ